MTQMQRFHKIFNGRRALAVPLPYRAMIFVDTWEQRMSEHFAAAKFGITYEYHSYNNVQYYE